MIDWLKRFAFSMFSDKRVAESTEYSIGNFLLTSVLAAVFLLIGMLVGRYALFGADYDNSEKFKSFAYNAFIDGGVQIDVLTIGNAEITVNGEHLVINTYDNAEDNEYYSKYGYGLIVDPNNVSTTYDDFYAYCKNKNDGTEISYDEYLKLAEHEKNAYSFCVRYSGKPKSIDADDEVAFTEYLKNVKNAEKRLAELEATRGSSSVTVYRNALYELYVEHYYPQMYDTTGEAVPTLRQYYYSFLGSADKNYMCVFGDMITASFATNVGKRVQFGIVYEKDGLRVDETLSRKQNQTAVDDFIKNGYYGGISMMIFSDYMSIILTILMAELIIVVMATIGFLVCKRLNIALGKTFGDCARIVGSYAHVAAFFAAIATVLCGFFAGGAAVIVIGAVVFFVIMSLRTTVLFVREYKREKAEFEKQENEQKIDYSDLSNERAD